MFASILKALKALQAKPVVRKIEVAFVVGAGGSFAAALSSGAPVSVAGIMAVIGAAVSAGVRAVIHVVPIPDNVA